MSLTGRFVHADEAERIGLVNRVVAADVVAEAITVARIIAGYDHTAVAAIRDLYTAHAHKRLDALQAHETTVFNQIVAALTPEAVRERRADIIARGRALTNQPGRNG